MQKLGIDLIELNRFSVVLAGLKINFKTTKLQYFEDFLAMLRAMAFDVEAASIACKVAWDLYFLLESKVTSSS